MNMAEVERRRMKKKKKRERKERQKCECPAISNPHSGKGTQRWPGSRLHHDISVFIEHKFPVPHRQSPPNRLSNLHKTPLITSGRKFRLRMTTRHTIYNEFCDLQCDFYVEKRAPQRGGSTYIRREIEFGAENNTGL